MSRVFRRTNQRSGHARCYQVRGHHADAPGAEMNQTDAHSSLFGDAMLEYETRTENSLAMGDARKLAERKDRGVLTARARIARLCASVSFIESGLIGGSSSKVNARQQTPPPQKMTGIDNKK